MRTNNALLLALCGSAAFACSLADPASFCRFSTEESGTSLYMHPVAAGFPSPAEDGVEAQLDLQKHLVRSVGTERARERR
ncbi:MAG: hypothetical protein K6F46_02625 [Desulfovibrio sp.]|nr:hypothetical protein [Desulfovibrio sp.]